MSYQTLFLQQSYRDCTKQYEEILHNPNLPLWDYVVLTASNEAQAQAYRAQISYRLKHQMLPEKTHYAVLPDPDGKRVGSGGATLNVLRYIREHAAGKQSPAAVPHSAVQSSQFVSAQPGEAACHAFDGKRILVIHSGGDSKRVPQYSACGKLFSPVPRILPNGRRSTLFDEFMIAMCGVAARMNAGMLVCSGDVLLLFNQRQIVKDFFIKFKKKSHFADFLTKHTLDFVLHRLLGGLAEMDTDDIGGLANLLSDSRASGCVGCGIVHSKSSCK